MAETNTFDKHKGRWALFIIGSALLIAYNPSYRPFDVMGMAAQIVGAGLLCGLIAGSAYLVSVLIRKRLTHNQVWDIFFVVYGVVAGLQLVGALVRG